MDWMAAIGAGILCAAMLTAEGLLSGRGFPQWLGSLRKPRLYAPMPVWIAVALLTYAIQAVIAYRLLRAPVGAGDLAALAALVAVMAANVAYNVIANRRRDPQFLYTGILWFLAPLAVLQLLLIAQDGMSAVLNAAYFVWVAAYDLPIMRTVSRLNIPQPPTRASSG